MREWLPSGTIVAHYQISSRLSANGLGEVYFANDISSGRDVALKLLPAAIIDKQGYRQRYSKIFASIIGLRHRNICEIYAGGVTDDGRPFIAMEYIKGQSLDSLGYGHQMSVDVIVSVIIQIADALEAAHSQGWLHLAIKPSNIMLHPSRLVKVLDFGQPLAFPPSLESDAGDPLKVTLGAVSYLSPEQIAGDRPDQRSDIFSLGAIFYELLSGHNLYSGSTVDEVIASHSHAEPVALTELREDVPPELNRIVNKAIARDLNERYKTAGELARDLRNLTARQLHWARWAKWATSMSDIKPENIDDDSRVGKTAADLGMRGKKGGAKGDRISAASFFGDIRQAFKNLMESATRGKTGGVEPIKLIRERSFFEDLFHLITNYWRRMLAVSLAILGIILAIAIAGNFLSGPQETEKEQGLFSTRITASGRVTEAVVSPFGDRLAYAVDDGGQQSLIIKDLDSNRETTVSSVSEKEYRGLAFSPDGRKISYIKTDPNEVFGALYQISVGGSPEENLNTGNVIGAACFSPDGKKVVYLSASENRSETSLNIVSPAGPVTVLATKKSPAFFYPGALAWSPDGHVIACVVKDEQSGSYLKITTIEVDGGGESTITSGRWSEIARVAWSKNGGGLIVAASEPTSHSSQLWKVAYPSGEVTRITKDLSDYRSPSLTKDGNRLFGIQSEALSNIWVASSVDFNRLQQLTTDRLDGYGGIAWTPDNHIVYSSWAGGRETIWLSGLRLNTQRLLPVAPEDGEGREYQPAVSPDGDRIAFVVERPNGAYLWTSDLTRRNLRRLTDENLVFFPSFSAEGKNVIYAALRESRRVVVRSSIEGRSPVTLIDKQSWRPVISPDGTKIACNYWDEMSGQWKIAVFPIEGGQPQLIFDAPGNFQRVVRWMPDSKGIVFIVNRGGISNLFMQSLSGGMPTQMTDFKSGRVFDFAWSRDGQHLAIAKGWVNSDVVIIATQ